MSAKTGSSVATTTRPRNSAPGRRQLTTGPTTTRSTASSSRGNDASYTDARTAARAATPSWSGSTCNRFRAPRDPARPIPYASTRIRDHCATCVVVARARPPAPTAVYSGSDPETRRRVGSQARSWTRTTYSSRDPELSATWRRDRRNTGGNRPCRRERRLVAAERRDRVDTSAGGGRR